MRILHLSDIHYCETKQEDFEDFLTKLISEIKEINQEAKIDFVLITGDLINKGGSQFIANKNKPYEFFEQNVLDPIMNSIDLSKNQVFIVPGNHDVEDVDPAKDKEEYYLLDQKLKYFNDLVVKHRKNTFGGNERIKKYKEFEKRFYKDYQKKFSPIALSPFESCWVSEFHDLKIGFVALNSAWRCSTKLPEDKLYLGVDKQVYYAKKFFEANNTDFNIALLHHPIDSIALEERSEVAIALSDAKIFLLFGGHAHKISAYQTVRQDTLFHSIARVGFTDKREGTEEYQAGFSLIDLSHNIYTPENINIQCTFYKYVHSSHCFDMDVLGGKGGRSTYQIPSKGCKPNFLSYLKTRSSQSTDGAEAIEAQKEAKRRMLSLWDSLTVAIIHSSFKNISTKLADNIRRTMLLDDQQFYNTNNVFHYTIRDFDENHFELLEFSTFSINTDKESINFDRTLVVEKLKENDNSDIFIEKLSINGEDYTALVQTLKPEPSTIDSRTIKIKKTFNIKLQSKTKYDVELVIRSIHTHHLNGYWRRYFSEITENVTVNLPENPDYEIDTLNFAKGMDIQKGFIPLGSHKSQEPVLFMPGDGFALIIKKIKQKL